MSLLESALVKEALSLIENARLPHPMGSLLSCFIVDALNPRLAAGQVLQGCEGSQDLEADLLLFVHDWIYIVESGTSLEYLMSVLEN
jgi:hypothetical protein